MRKVFFALMLGLAAISCAEVEEVVKPEVFEVLATVDTLSANAGTVDVKISTDYTDFEVVMATTEPWVTFVETKSAAVVEKTLTFAYTANPAMTIRKEAAKIVAGGVTLGEIIFIQAEGLPCVFEVSEVAKLRSAAGTLDVTVNVDYPEFEVAVDAEWLTFVETKGITDAVKKTLTFAYEANRVKSERTANVTVSAAGEQIGTFAVTQEAYDKIVLEAVATRYSTADGAAWCSFIPGIANRSMASDGKYVYLNSSEGTAKIYAVEIASLLAGDANPAYKALDVTGMTGGTHAISTVEVLPNENGDPVLVATNLAIDGNEVFRIYAYSNGIDAAPVVLHEYRWDGCANVSDWRRYGDRISVSGTWQNGSIWAAANNGTKVMGFRIENGATDADHREYCWFDGFGGGLAEATIYPGTDNAIVTTAAYAQFFSKNTAGETHSGGFWPKWDGGNKVEKLNGSFSFQFFTLGDYKYIAFVQLADNTHCNLVVVEDTGDFETSLAGEALYTIPLYEGEEASCKAGNTYGDCSVVEINGTPHIVAMMQGGGLAIFEMK